MKKKVKSTGVYAYLERSNAFDSNSTEVIEQAKRAYRKEYKYKWKQAKKSKTKEYSVIFTIDESKDIAAAAAQHKRTVPRFIKESSLAYLRRAFVVPDLVAIREIRQLLTYTFLTLKKLAEDERINYRTERIVIEQLEQLERQILQQLQHPKEL